MDKDELYMWAKRHAVALWNFIAVGDFAAAAEEAAMAEKKCRELSERIAEDNR
jgi:hypothetical protein